jgi:hypothetical protein
MNDGEQVALAAPSAKLHDFYPSFQRPAVDARTAAENDPIRRARKGAPRHLRLAIPGSVRAVWHSDVRPWEVMT